MEVSGMLWGGMEPLHSSLTLPDTMEVFERVCGWMLETRRRRITFRGFRSYPLTHGLVAWLEEVSHGLTGLPPQPPQMGRGMNRSSQAGPPGLQVADACSPAHITTGGRGMVWKAASLRQGSGLLKKGGRS